MKRITMLLAAGVLILSSMLYAAVPQLINFQGILKDGSGNPVADGAYAVTFTVYDAPAGGSVQWAETTSVTTTDGLFSILLGSTNPVAETLFQNPSRYLGIKVGADPEMTPRTQLAAVAYAQRVATVDGATGGTISGDVQIQSNLNVSDTVEMSAFKMPTGADSGKVLTSDSAGTGSWQMPSGGGGSVFTRWGNGTAPAGTELIYSGYAYASHYSQLGPMTPIVLKTGDPGPLRSGNNFGLLYPVMTFGPISTDLPPGIPDRRYMKAAVCLANKPTVTMWGTHTAPTGWDVIYQGYALGPFYNYNNPVGPICVDNQNYDTGSALGTTDFALYFGVKVWDSTPVPSGDETLRNNLVKCVVCKKQ